MTLGLMLQFPHCLLHKTRLPYIVLQHVAIKWRMMNSLSDHGIFDLVAVDQLKTSYSRTAGVLYTLYRLR